MAQVHWNSAEKVAFVNQIAESILHQADVETGGCGTEIVVLGAVKVQPNVIAKDRRKTTFELRTWVNRNKHLVEDRVRYLLDRSKESVLHVIEDSLPTQAVKEIRKVESEFQRELKLTLAAATERALTQYRTELTAKMELVRQEVMRDHLLKLDESLGMVATMADALSTKAVVEEVRKRVVKVLIIGVYPAQITSIQKEICTKALRIEFLKQDSPGMIRSYTGSPDKVFIMASQITSGIVPKYLLDMASTVNIRGNVSSLMPLLRAFVNEVTEVVA